MTSNEGLLFIHTIDGKPGFFDGEQIVCALQRDHWNDDYPLVVPCRSVEQIRNERTISEAYRLRHRFDVPRYDFIVVTTGRRRRIGAEDCK